MSPGTRSDWQARRSPGVSRAELESATLTYLATMPAWRDHPVVRAHVGGGTGR
ncbi:MAG TPA: hypothetical protein VFP72_11420 [Kineosporiaceae bacterium]|nr:hypothetical protein [Kineosporiaceae bacterium]